MHLIEFDEKLYDNLVALKVDLGKDSTMTILKMAIALLKEAAMHRVNTNEIRMLRQDGTTMILLL